MLSQYAVCVQKRLAPFDILLKQIHALVGTTAEPQEVCDSANTDFGEHQPDHTIEHGGHIANSQSLSHNAVWCARLVSKVPHMQDLESDLTVCAHSQ